MDILVLVLPPLGVVVAFATVFWWRIKLRRDRAEGKVLNRQKNGTVGRE
ncbi:MAG: hypothetical protein Q7S75_01440 [bacterium]|nr:hypothetical protein [bacterium]